MALRILELGHLRGKLNRADYAVWGVLLFILKYNIDRLISGGVFGATWYPWSYLLGRGGLPVMAFSRSFLATLLLVSLPFVYVGVALTLRRLADAGWPRWLVLLFFVPFLNVLFFACLCSCPSKTETETEASTPRGLHRFAADNPWKAASLGLVVSVVLGGGALLFSVRYFESYAWGSFVGIPFLMGFSSAGLPCLGAKRTWRNCAATAIFSVFILFLIILGIAVEGVVCLIMAAPIAIGLALLGATVAWMLQRDTHPPQDNPAFRGSSMWLALPFLLAAEARIPGEAPTFSVTSTCEIDATPDVVWRHVVSFGELPPAREAVFRAGIAYPVRARLEGRGVGSIRYCEFSTGPFVEPITVWEENRRLAFGVERQPRPMQEWSPYGAIEPAHLNAFFRSKRGEFRLVALPNNRTRLEGTTWYEQDIAPQQYWRLWSDYLVHTIHQRVLDHIKNEAEGEKSGRRELGTITAEGSASPAVLPRG